MRSQELINDALDDAIAEQERIFKQECRNKIAAIATVQRSIAELFAKQATLRAELRSMELSPIDKRSILGE